ncbi:MAG TPA: ribosome small subunit-dependent GTPase A [Candidatus Brocadiia bacterium]|nr:ribosome small subunit-dependent GTPase A [Candidatus Brocadiia bacterium]
MGKGEQRFGNRGSVKKAVKAFRASRKDHVRDKSWRRATPEQDLDAAEARDLKMRRSRENLPSSLVKLLAELADRGTVDFSAPGVETGVVASARKKECLVLVGDETVECVIPTDLALFQKMTVAVGDRVAVARDKGAAVVTGVAPRRSRLARPDPHIPGMERVLAANVDLVVAVASVAQPGFSAGMVDRCFIAAQRGGAEALLCLNKMDLGQAPDEAAVYRQMGMRVIETSCVDGRGIEELKTALGQRTCVFVGHSGVGKSSLLNAIDPSLGAKVGPVRESDGRGRHTTTFASLRRLACGAWVIDTPGVREFGLWRMSPEEVSYYFPDFKALPPCKFRDCGHTHEPGCSVKAAVESGALATMRYESYLRILESLEKEE